MSDRPISYPAGLVRLAISIALLIFGSGLVARPTSAEILYARHALEQKVDVWGRQNRESGDLPGGLRQTAIISSPSGQLLHGRTEDGEHAIWVRGFGSGETSAWKFLTYLPEHLRDTNPVFARGSLWILDPLEEAPVLLRYPVSRPSGEEWDEISPPMPLKLFGLKRIDALNPYLDHWGRLIFTDSEGSGSSVAGDFFAGGGSIGWRLLEAASRKTPEDIDVLGAEFRIDRPGELLTLTWDAKSHIKLRYRTAPAQDTAFGPWSEATANTPLTVNRIAQYLEYRLEKPAGDSSWPKTLTLSYQYPDDSPADGQAPSSSAAGMSAYSGQSGDAGQDESPSPSVAGSSSAGSGGQSLALSATPIPPDETQAKESEGMGAPAGEGNTDSEDLKDSDTTAPKQSENAHTSQDEEQGVDKETEGIEESPPKDVPGQVAAEKKNPNGSVDEDEPGTSDESSAQPVNGKKDEDKAGQEEEESSEKADQDGSKPANEEGIGKPDSGPAESDRNQDADENGPKEEEEEEKTGNDSPSAQAEEPSGKESTDEQDSGSGGYESGDNKSGSGGSSGSGPGSGSDQSGSDSGSDAGSETSSPDEQTERESSQEDESKQQDGSGSDSSGTQANRPEGGQADGSTGGSAGSGGSAPSGGGSASGAGSGGTTGGDSGNGAESEAGSDGNSPSGGGSGSGTGLAGSTAEDGGANNGSGPNVSQSAQPQGSSSQGADNASQSPSQPLIAMGGESGDPSDSVPGGNSQNAHSGANETELANRPGEGGNAPGRPQTVMLPELQGISPGTGNSAVSGHSGEGPLVAKTPSIVMKALWGGAGAGGLGGAWLLWFLFFRKQRRRNLADLSGGDADGQGVESRSPDKGKGPQSSPGQPDAADLEVGMTQTIDQPLEWTTLGELPGQLAFLATQHPQFVYGIDDGGRVFRYPKERDSIEATRNQRPICFSPIRKDPVGLAVSSKILVVVGTPAVGAVSVAVAELDEDGNVSHWHSVPYPPDLDPPVFVTIRNRAVWVMATDGEHLQVYQTAIRDGRPTRTWKSQASLPLPGELVAGAIVPDLAVVLVERADKRGALTAYSCRYRFSSTFHANAVFPWSGRDIGITSVGPELLVLERGSTVENSHLLRVVLDDVENPKAWLRGPSGLDARGTEMVCQSGGGRVLALYRPRHPDPEERSWRIEAAQIQ